MPNAHDVFACTARYPFPCANPVAFYLEWESTGEDFPPADRYTCAEHVDIARQGDVIMCVMGDCHPYNGQAWLPPNIASVLVDGKPYCHKHARRAEMVARHAALRARPTCEYGIDGVECGQDADARVTWDQRWADDCQPMMVCRSHASAARDTFARDGGVEIVRL